MDILTHLQRDLLKQLSLTPLAEQFFLTGETALAECYLQHRYSEDLDLFTEVPDGINQAKPILEACAARLGGRVRFTRRFDSILEAIVDHAEGTVMFHFAQDGPYRLQPIDRTHAIGFPVDNVLDMACNKLVALFDRASEKDFVDIYFLHQERIPLVQLITQASQKHIGMDSYGLAQVFERVHKVERLPRMIKPLELDALKAFFIGHAKRLMDDLYKKDS